MKTREEIQTKLDSLCGDDRVPVKYGGTHPQAMKLATLAENAPLALTQLELGGKIDALKWVLA